MNNQEITAVFIPARIDSRRIPGKNLADIGGIPLLAHSIRIANQLNDIIGVFLSTDSDEVTKAVINESCIVIRRDGGATEYEATNYDVIKDALPKIAGHINGLPDIIILLQPTHPFRSLEEINHAVKIFKDNPDASCLITVTQVKEAIGKINNGSWQAITSMSAKQRLSEEPVYQNSGNFYMFRTALTFSKNDFFGENILAYPLSKPVLDINIDLPHELQLARLIQNHGYDLLGLEYNPALGIPKQKK